MQPTARTVRQLFEGRTYHLDSYQRDYAWEITQVEKLVDDLAAKFTWQWDETHLESDTLLYDSYFLGSIIIYRENERIYLADGQQRVITLLLLLIRLGTLTEDRHDATHLHSAVRTLMRGGDHGGQHFAVRVDRYAEFFDQLANNRLFTSDGAPADVRRLHEAAEHLLTRWPENLKQDQLPYFARWLLDRVSLVELDAGDAARGKEMFSAMNDRGKHLAPLDLLKNYLLADAPGDPYQLDLRWQHMVDELHGPDRDAPLEFVRAVLRAKYVKPAADTSQLLASAPHEWLDENAESIGQNQKRDGRVRLFTEILEPLSRPYLAMQMATGQLRADQEAIWYNAHLRIPRQFDLALAAAEPNESNDLNPSVLRKGELVARFLDLYVVTRGVRQLPYGPSELDELVAGLLGPVRMTRTTDELSRVLGEAAAGWYVHLAEIPELRYRPGANRPFVLYFLARLTAWLAKGTGQSETVEHLLAITEGQRPFEIEHLFTKSERTGTYRAQAESDAEFDRLRSRLGGLVLLDGSDNASAGGLPLERKLTSYLRSNGLAGSLHPDTYRSRGHKRFNTFVAEQGLTDLFHPYDVESRPEDIVNARGRLYRAMAERIWSPEALGLPLPRTAGPYGPAGGNNDGDGGDDDERPRRQRYKTTLTNLIDAGLLRADERLVGRRGGQLFPATLTADGRIRTASGEVHRSVSAAAKAATGASNPGDWRFWRVEHTNDTLFAVRARYLRASDPGQNG